MIWRTAAAVVFLAFAGLGSAPSPRTFVSLVPACACARHTELELFSASSGREVRSLAAVSRDGYQQLSTPSATRGGRLFFTFTSGSVCTVNGYIECPKFKPDSCRNAVSTFSIGQAGPQPLFTVAGSEAIGPAVPDPAGRRVALMMTPCTAPHGATGLFIRTLKSGTTYPITTSANGCDQFGPAAWNATGTRVVFPLQRVSRPPTQIAGGVACSIGRNYLGLASTTPGHSRLKLINPDRGCEFRAAAFDRIGIVAAEGCKQGDPEPGADSYLGDAFLVQYGPQGGTVMRLGLKLGLEQAVISAEPDSGSVLVTQDQPANEPYPERDWVWEFDGSSLRPIAHYKAEDAAQVLAVAW